MHPELSFYLFEYSVLLRSEVVKTSALLLPSLLGVYDRPNNQPTNITDRHEGYREAELPMTCDTFLMSDGGISK